MINEMFEKYLTEKKQTPSTSQFSSLGKRLGVRYLQSQTLEEKLNVNTGILLVVLGSVCNSKSLGSLGLKVSQGKTETTI